MDNKEPTFAFGKKLGITENYFFETNMKCLLDCIERLLFCMKETNKNHGVECEFFRLDFRQPYFDEKFEFPLGCFLLDLKWGSKKEFQEKHKENADEQSIQKID